MLRFLAMLWSAFRHGQVYGQPVTRNLLAWIPGIFVLPIGFAVWLLCIVGYILLLPLILALGWLSLWLFQRKAGVFSEQGIHFPKAYGRLTIAWSDVREVVREREPKAAYYRIICGAAPGEVRRYIMSSTPDNEAFERTLQERHIPFRARAWFDRTEPVT